MMSEYEIQGKTAIGPFIKSESNAAKLLNMLEINKDATATFIYGHLYREAKGILRIDPTGYSYNIEYYGDDPFEMTTIPYPFQTIEIEIKPERILEKRKKLGLNEKGYRFRGFEYHPLPRKIGIHISASRNKKETAAFVSAKAKDYSELDKFKNAMKKLGFTNLGEKIIRHKIMDFRETMKI